MLEWKRDEFDLKVKRFKKQRQDSYIEAINEKEQKEGLKDLVSK